jgi:hypothetical protein
MNRKIKNILALMIISFPTLMMVSCEKDINEGDDFITGKWRNINVINDTNSTPEELLSYVEYAPYNYDFDKRTVTDYICKIQEGNEEGTFDTIFTPQQGNYTISGDTLTVVDYMQITKTYFIQKIKQDTLTYKDSKGKIYTYIKYKK